MTDDALKNILVLDTSDQELLIKCGVLSLNEVREAFGLDPIEGGSINMIETGHGLIPVERLDTFFRQLGLDKNRDAVV